MKKLRKKVFTDQEISNMYLKDKMSLREIGRVTGMLAGSVYYRLLRAKVEPRRRGSWWLEFRTVRPPNGTRR